MNLLTVIITLIAIESGGNNAAVGDQGELGCLQIKKIVVDDINQNILHRDHFTYEDRLSRVKSVEMCQLYLDFYATDKRIGRRVVEKDIVRIWNGGPDGWKKPETLPYWNRYMHKKPDKKVTR